MNRQFDGLKPIKIWVDEFNEYDWEQLIKQEPLSCTDANECLEPENICKETDREYIRCN